MSTPTTTRAPRGLFDAARTGRRTTHPLTAVAVVVVVFLVSTVLKGVLLRDPSPGASAVASALAFVPAVVPAYGFRVVVVWLWLSRREGRPLRTVGLPRDRAVRRAAGGFAAGLAALGTAAAVLAATGHLHTDPGRTSPYGAAAAGGVLLMGVAWLVQGPAEEIVFRGFLLQSFGVRGLVVLGVGVQAALFALAHGAALVSPVAALNLVLFAVLAAVWAVRQGSLWGVCGFHVGWNWALGNGLGLTVSGQQVPGGSVLATRLTGGTALTGGDFGVEGSLVVTAVLAVAVLVAALSGPRRPARRRG